MRRGVSGFGFVILILACATVVYLALRSFEEMQRASREAREPVFAGETVLQDEGGTDRGAPAPPPLRPSLSEAREKTRAHSQRVSTALDEAD